MKSQTIEVSTCRRNQMVDITRDLASALPSAFSGCALIYCPHTTAGLTINENADPDVVGDLLAQLDRTIPWNAPHYRHSEGNSAAHLKASLVGSSLSVPVIDGRFALGTWQGVYFCEFDGPRQRRVSIHLLAGLEEESRR